VGAKSNQTNQENKKADEESCENSIFQWPSLIGTGIKGLLIRQLAILMRKNPRICVVF